MQQSAEILTEMLSNCCNKMTEICDTMEKCSRKRGFATCYDEEILLQKSRTHWTEGS